MECYKCHIKFISKQRLESHLNRSIPCDRVKQCNRCLKIFMTNRNLEKHLNKTIPCDMVEEPNVVEYQCEYCSRNFSFKSSMTRHQRLYCESKNQYDRAIEQVRTQIAFMIASNVLNNNPTNNDNTNNSNNTNEVSNNTVNSFGKENTDYITKEMLMNLIQKYAANLHLLHITLSELIHYNNEHSENKNVKMQNIRDKRVKIMTINGEKFHNADYIVPRMINKNDRLIKKNIHESENGYSKNYYKEQQKLMSGMKLFQRYIPDPTNPYLKLRKLYDNLFLNHK